MREPAGFEPQKHPLFHKMYYAAGLSPVTVGKNTCSFAVIRNYKGAVNPDTIDVNPKHTNFLKEGGAVCNPMSIIDRLTIKLNFSYTEDANNDQTPLKCWWQPIFFSFPEKLDAADEVSTTTVATILQLVKDATQEDVTPLFNNLKHSVVGASDRSHPVSTVNLAESALTHLNMDTNATSEGVTWDDDLVQSAMQYYTNKGALKACLGRRRFFTLHANKRQQSYFVKKRPPRAVRRIMPYSYMAIICHVPLVSEDDQTYFSKACSIDVAYVGVTCKIRYHEWHNEHNQDLTG